MVEMTGEMFAMPVAELCPDMSVPFPLFIYFPNSDRYVIASIPHAYLDAAAIARIQARLHSVWVPQKFHSDYEQYLAAAKLQPKKVAPPIAAPKEAPAKKLGTPQEEAELKATIAQFKNAFTDDSLSLNEKRQIFSHLSREALTSLVNIESNDPEEKRKGLRKCSQITYEIMLLASTANDLYKEILEIRSFKQDLEHSVVVSAVAVMIAMGLGVVEKSDIETLTFAAFLHDIGLGRIQVELAAKPYSEFSPEDWKNFNEHIHQGISMLSQSGLHLSDEILEIIREHHENFDGSGFPDHLSGEAIHDFAQILAAADWWDELTCGKIDGEKHTPLESFQIILAKPERGGTQRLNPELVEEIRRIFA